MLNNDCWQCRRNDKIKSQRRHYIFAYILDISLVFNLALLLKTNKHLYTINKTCISVLKSCYTIQYLAICPVKIIYTSPPISLYNWSHWVQACFLRYLFITASYVCFTLNPSSLLLLDGLQSGAWFYRQLLN